MDFKYSYYKKKRNGNTESTTKKQKEKNLLFGFFYLSSILRAKAKRLCVYLQIESLVL